MAYGQDQCSTIPKIIRRKLRGKSLFVYTGGLPRSMKDEKFTVSVIHKGHPVNFDFSSKVRRNLFFLKTSPKKHF